MDRTQPAFPFPHTVEVVLTTDGDEPQMKDGHPGMTYEQWLVGMLLTGLAIHTGETARAIVASAKGMARQTVMLELMDDGNFRQEINPRN